MKEDKFAIFLMETEAGPQIQLFKDMGKAKESFDNLTGFDKGRATLLCLDYVKGEAEMSVKELPTLGVSYSAYKIGEGPFEEEDEPEPDESPEESEAPKD